METIETKPNNDAELTDFIVITEHRCDCTIKLISFALLLIGALISYKYSDFTFLLMVLLFSLMVLSLLIVQSLLHIPAKIELSKDQMVICYGRHFMDNQHIEARFPLVERIKWENITALNLTSYVHTTTNGESDIEFTYRYLVITDRSIINLSRNPNERCKIRLNDFEKKPEEILDICKQFQIELTRSS